MAGIVGFLDFESGETQALKGFYTARLGFEIRQESEDRLIVQRGNLILGFRSTGRAPGGGATATPTVTLLLSSRAEVDALYGKLASDSLAGPPESQPDGEYGFRARDPEGRVLEFTTGGQRPAPAKSGVELLAERRSVRRFTEQPVPEQLLWQVFELCRTSPTAHNTQSYFYLVLRDPAKQKQLAALRGSSTAPIARAPAAVAIYADPRKTQRAEQDACIAAYHFLLAAELYGLGTCWMADMNRDRTKDILGIDRRLHLATVTPLGFPAEPRAAKKRREAREFVRLL